MLGYLGRYIGFGLLYGLSLGYRTIVQLWRRCYQTGIFRQHSLLCPVISIGNITTGGTGKTPLVILAAQILQQYGQRVTILSRGYRRQGSTSLTLTSQLERSQRLEVAHESDVGIVGDEPLLMARKFQRSDSPPLPAVSVIVGKNRYAAGKLALAQFHPDVVLLDDGFQHIQLERTCDLVLIDATQPFGGDCLLPAGFLREPVKNLARAHAFVITHSDEVVELALIYQRLRQINPAAPIFKGRHVYDTIRPAGATERIALERLKDMRLLGVSGLGNPASFQRLLAQLGVSVEKYLDFPDHHWYTTQDAEAIRQIVATHGIAAVLTTEKDEVKLLRYAARLNIPIFVLTIKIEVQPAREFEDFLLRALSSIA